MMQWRWKCIIRTFVLLLVRSFSPPSAPRTITGYLQPKIVEIFSCCSELHFNTHTHTHTGIRGKKASFCAPMVRRVCWIPWTLLVGKCSSLEVPEAIQPRDGCVFFCCCSSSLPSRIFYGSKGNLKNAYRSSLFTSFAAGKRLQWPVELNARILAIQQASMCRSLAVVSRKRIFFCWFRWKTLFPH